MELLLIGQTLVHLDPSRALGGRIAKGIEYQAAHLHGVDVIVNAEGDLLALVNIEISVGALFDGHHFT